MLTIEWLNQEWGLLPEFALHWPAHNAAIVADVHFGKAAAFRHHGVPVPAGTTARDLARLSSIISQTRCERLIVLGDLLHAKHGRADDTMHAVTRWRAAHSSIHIMLVRGNHDHAAGDPPDEWKIECVDEPFVFGGLNLRHAPDSVASPAAGRSRASIAGHVHPCVRLRDADGSSLRAACFVFSPDAILLPAFGSFTGGHVVRPTQGDRVFAIGGENVIEVCGPGQAIALNPSC